LTCEKLKIKIFRDIIKVNIGEKGVIMTNQVRRGGRQQQEQEQLGGSQGSPGSERKSQEKGSQVL